MDEMLHSATPRAKGRWTAIAVLLVALAATLFAWWRERELARRAQVIRWQDGFAQLQPVLAPLLGANFETFRDLAKTTLLRDGISQATWNDYVNVSEWQQRFPGMLELGYAELKSEKCTVKFLASALSSPAHAPGFDLNSDSAIRVAVEKSAHAGSCCNTHTVITGPARSAVTR